MQEPIVLSGMAVEPPDGVLVDFVRVFVPIPAGIDPFSEASQKPPSAVPLREGAD
jgi:hypothetical protein